MRAVKLSGMLFVIAAGTAFGFYRAYGFQKRIAHIILLQNAFRMLETEIFYTLTPVPAALKILEARMETPLQPFFSQVCDGIETGGLPVFQAWEQGIKVLQQSSFCRKEELDAVKCFGMSLGEGDVYAQQKNFQLLQQRLQYTLEEAERQRTQQGKVWQYMGVCVSMAIVILLY
jgi:stage III sporulation protein AB